MKILVISHNVFSNSENMGKTLYKLFSGFHEENICQLYFHSEVPTVENVCNQYYRITDKDVLKSIFNRRVTGTRFTKKQVCSDLNTSRTDSGTIAKIYQKGRKRTPLIYMMRDCMWKLGKWFSSDLKLWLNENRPDVIFYAAGDYSFSYNIAYKLAKYLSIPLIVYCVDDYYLYNMNENSVLGRLRQKLYMKSVKKTINLASSIVTICDKMAVDYSCFFKKKCHVLSTTAEEYSVEFSNTPKMFAYFGSLGLKRDSQLIEIGKAVVATQNLTGINTVDVFTAEKNSKILENLSKAQGITLHNSVSEKEMLEILKNCIAVIHTESFDDGIRKRIRYSVSTKIAESLMYGPCLFAYGPQDVASIEYLQKYSAAYVINNKEALEKGLIKLFTDSNMRKEIIHSARNVAKEKHCSDKNHFLLSQLLEEAKNEITGD